MTNDGNIVLFTQWNSSDFTRATATKNWTLRGWDFQLDDDNSQSSEDSGVILQINITNTTTVYFNHSTGLELCVAHNCNDNTLNETLDTYWHVYPVTGLGAGTYQSTITYVLKT